MSWPCIFASCSWVRACLDNPRVCQCVWSIRHWCVVPSDWPQWIVLSIPLPFVAATAPSPDPAALPPTRHSTRRPSSLSPSIQLSIILQALVARAPHPSRPSRRSWARYSSSRARRLSIAGSTPTRPPVRQCLDASRSPTSPTSIAIRR